MNSANSDRRRTRQPPPTSLPDHFSRKGYLSVSDLVGPSWCEFNYQYGILSLSHLPPSQRPATITTSTGQVLTAAPEIVEKKDATLTAGKAVHTVLEKEVAPVQVYVETETKEDRWALRLLNLWCDMQGLLRLEPGGEKGGNGGKGKGKACVVREVPVYGWIHGVFVMGVIDEIEKQAMELEPKEKEAGKTWASQEEWKKDQLRKQTSPKKAKTNGNDAKKKSVRPLTSFFGSQLEPKPDPPSQPAEPKEGWGYFLSDTKTRISSWLPAEEDQFSARMQCMTYKRLFDGLLLGALSSSSLSPSTSSLPNTAAFDSNTTPMDWTSTFAALDLDRHQPLSTAFLRDAEPLCESWGLDLALFVVQQDADLCTLHHIRLLLEEGLRELVRDARKGQGISEEESLGMVGAIQDKLALTYRKQSQRRRRKRKKAPESPAKKEVGGEGDGLRQMTLHDTTTAKTELQSQAKKEDPPDGEGLEMKTPEPAEVAEGAETRKSIDALEGRNDASHAITQAMSSPTPCTPRKPSSQSPSKTLSTSPTSATSPTQDSESESASTIIGVVPFPHNPTTLNTYLQRMIAMWKGERDLVGVSSDQTRRCWTCEWIHGCEWRSVQSDLRLRSAQKKAQIQVEFEEGEDGEFWNTLDYDAIEVRDADGKLLDW